jgi:hypothetical protein
MSKTPQEKKILSYAKDRRNTYGENSKASRKNIPLSKALASRADRHAQDRALDAAAASRGEDELVGIEGEVRGAKPRQWRKTPDQPLGKVLAQRSIKKAIGE